MDCIPVRLRDSEVCWPLISSTPVYQFTTSFLTCSHLQMQKWVRSWSVLLFLNLTRKFLLVIPQIAWLVGSINYQFCLMKVSFFKLYIQKLINTHWVKCTVQCGQVVSLWSHLCFEIQSHTVFLHNSNFLLLDTSQDMITCECYVFTSSGFKTSIWLLIFLLPLKTVVLRSTY